MWYQSLSHTSPESNLGILYLHNLQVHWYLGWKIRYKLIQVTNWLWDEELKPWETLQITWSASLQPWIPTHPHPRLQLINRSQGCTPARKYTPGYANSQQKFREHVQAGITPNNRIWAHSGEKPNHRLTEPDPGEREMHHQLTWTLRAPNLAFHWRDWKPDCQRGEGNKWVITCVLLTSIRGGKTVRLMKNVSGKVQSICAVYCTRVCTYPRTARGWSEDWANLLWNGVVRFISNSFLHREGKKQLDKREQKDVWKRILTKEKGTTTFAAAATVFKSYIDV